MPTTINRIGQVVICIRSFDDPASVEVAERWGIPRPKVGERYIVEALPVCRGCGEHHQIGLQGMHATKPLPSPGQTLYNIPGFFVAEEIRRSSEIGGLIAIANGTEPDETVEDKTLYRRPPPDGVSPLIRDGQALLRDMRARPSAFSAQGKLRTKIAAEFARSPVLLDIDGSILSGKLRARAAAFAGVHSVAALVLGDESEWPATLILQPWRVRHA